MIVSLQTFDWLHEFAERFVDEPRLQGLRKQKFHGNVTLNFSDGVVMNCKKEDRINPTSTLT